MLNENTSNKLWQLLESRAADSRMYFFSSNVEDGGIRLDTFSVWRRLKSGRREKKRDYYRTVRDSTGRVLYDQLEDVSLSFIEGMATDKLLVPDARISPNKANKLLTAMFEQQQEVDRLIAAEGR